MFSGIITQAQSAKRKKQNNSIVGIFCIPKGWKIREGDSISIDGICTTVASISENNFSVYWMPETIKRTSLSGLNQNHVFNLEQPITMQTLLNGHMVTGHIDTVGTVSNVTKVQQSADLKIQLSSEFTRYLIYKGSVAVNGVSLTVVTVGKNFFTVSLIPYTLSHTNLGQLKKGDKVNIEVDMIAKYLEKYSKK